MIGKPGQIQKWIIRIGITLTLAAAIGLGLPALARDLAHTRVIPGIRTYLPKEDICAIALDDQTIWAGGTDGLFKLTRGSDLEFAIEKIGTYQYIKAVLVHGNQVWIGHDNGLTLIQGEGVTNYTVKEGLPDNRVNALCLDPEGNLWIGTWGGAVLLEDGRIVRTIQKEDGLIDDMVNVIMQDSQGGIWFGSYVAPRGGISILYRGQWRRFSSQDGLVHPNVNAIIETAGGEVIEGGGLYTKGGGTRFSFRNSQWERISTLGEKDGLAGAKIRSLFEDSKGRLWVGSEYEGLAVLADGTATIMTEDNGLSNNEVKSIAEESDGTIWIGTREGLVRIDKGGIENVQ